MLLTTFLTPLAILCSWTSIHENVKGFFIAILVIETAMIGVFVSLDLFLFFLFWELTLIPMYFMIGIWGHDRRIYAAVKFILYTMFGSILMLVAILWLYNLSNADRNVRPAHSAGAIAARHNFAAADHRTICCSARFSWPSRLRFRCSRSIPGCLTRTPKRPRPVR